MKGYPILALAITLTATLLAKGMADTVTDSQPVEVALTPAMTDMELEKHRFPDLEASYLPHWALHAQHGMPGVTFRFTNSAVNERHFLISVGANLYAKTQKRFAIPPGGTVTFTLFAPFLGIESIDHLSHNIFLRETTPAAKPVDVEPRFTIQRHPVSRYNFDVEQVPSMLLSGRISANRFRDDLSQAMWTGQYAPKYGQKQDPRTRYGAPKTPEKQPYTMTAVQFTFPAADWPRDWRCYSTYDAVVITDGEYASLGDETKSALEAYRLFGGAVIVTKGGDGFAGGDEAIQALQAIDASCETLSAGGLAPRNVSKQLKQIPINAKSTVPVKTLLLVLALFAFAIVPLAVLRGVKRNRRMRLLAILPGAAALFAVLIALTAFLFFGTTPSVRLQSVTLLDQTTKKALTRGQCAIFTPISIERHLSFPIDAAFAKWVHLKESGDNRKTFVDVADAQRLGGKWTPPLVTSFFDFNRFCDRSEKLDFRVAPSGEVTVVNLLGARVVKGHANIGGELWAFHDIPPGGQVVAEKRNVKPNPPSPRHPFGSKTAFGRDWESNRALARSGADELPAGEYVAEVDGSPFFPNPVSGKTTDTQAEGIIYGRFKEVTE